jgi:hypothetical protein
MTENLRLYKLLTAGINEGNDIAYKHFICSATAACMCKQEWRP